MASRGHAGGLAATSTAAAAVLDAAGFDLILIETVGTGQSEVEVAAAADTTVVLEAPEMGDEVQAIKAGLLEVADLVVVNKGDKPGRPADRRAAPGDAGRLGTAERSPPDRPRPKRPDVLITTAATGAGVPELLAALDRHREVGRVGESSAARLARAEAQVFADRRGTSPGPVPRAARGSATVALLAEVAAHRLDPYSAADQLLGAHRLVTAKRPHPPARKPAPAPNPARTREPRVPSTAWRPRSSASSWPAPG